MYFHRFQIDDLGLIDYNHGERRLAECRYFDWSGFVFNIIVAYDQNRGIGKDNKLPWNIPDDLKHFQQMTLGKTVIMGRKTYESIGQPLEGRANIVLTSSWGNVEHDPLKQQNITIFKDPEPILNMNNKEDMFIIGGQKIFELFLPHVKRIYATEIHDTFDCDTFFPEFKHLDFKEIERKPGSVDEENQIPHDFVVYERSPE